MKPRNYHWVSGVQILWLQQNQSLILVHEPIVWEEMVLMPMGLWTEDQCTYHHLLMVEGQI